jgi:hypothetical protein
VIIPDSVRAPETVGSTPRGHPYFALWRLLEPDALSTPEALADFPRERRARHFIRRTKEEMVKLDGTPLYPQRLCDTLGFDLTKGPGSEQELYDETSKYIRSRPRKPARHCGEQVSAPFQALDTASRPK